VAPLRDFGHSDASLSLNPDPGDRTPFDWRQAQLRQDGGSWKLAAGGLVLADFGGDAQAARQAWSAMQYYRFTERREVGDAAGKFRYFLVAGQPPEGLMFGVDSQPLPADRLEVRQAGGRWAVCAGDQALVETGGSEAAARQVLELIRQQKCDRLCRVGGDGGMVFLVRSR
jgi:hypothetical protein